MFSQIKDRKHIEQSFHSVARVMSRGAGGSKTLVWGFAMTPHRLRILIHLYKHQQETKVPFLAICGTFSRKLLEIHQNDNRTSILFTVACNISTLYCDHSGCTGSELLNVVC